MTKDDTPRKDPIGRVIAGNLRRLRQHKGWTQAKTAERLAIYIDGTLSSAAISQWEEGRLPDQTVRRFSVSDVWAICRVFDVPLARLLMPGVWAPAVEEIPDDLFGETYSTVWGDCFASTTSDDEDNWSRLDGAAEMADKVRVLGAAHTPPPDDELRRALEVVEQEQQERERRLSDALDVIAKAREEGRL